MFQSFTYYDHTFSYPLAVSVLAKCHPVTGYYENLYICSYEARLLAVKNVIALTECFT